MKLIRFSKNDQLKYEIDTNEKVIRIIPNYDWGEYHNILISFDEITNLHDLIKNFYFKQPVNL